MDASGPSPVLKTKSPDEAAVSGAPSSWFLAPAHEHTVPSGTSVLLTRWLRGDFQDARKLVGRGGAQLCKPQSDNDLNCDQLSSRRGNRVVESAHLCLSVCLLLFLFVCFVFWATPV